MSSNKSSGRVVREFFRRYLLCIMSRGHEKLSRSTSKQEPLNLQQGASSQMLYPDLLCSFTILLYTAIGIPRHHSSGSRSDLFATIKIRNIQVAILPDKMAASEVTPFTYILSLKYPARQELGWVG